MRLLTVVLFALVVLVPAASFSKNHGGEKHRSDQELKTVLRKKAPFWLADGEVNVRLNKDASFGSDAAGGALNLEGKWRVEKSQLILQWTADKREKSFAVTIVNRAPVIAGAPLKDGRFSVGSSP